ncbi:MAG: endonuclease/exonuclease/phosphatase family protein [Bacteroidaceae bacterium]
MKRLIGRTSALLVCLLVTVWPVRASIQKMRIMTFNIPYGNIKVTEGNGQNTWENRAKAIHQYVDSISPDVWGIQEGVKDELTSILAGIPGYAMVGCARNDGAESGEYTPILYKTARFLLEKSGNFWLTDTPDTPSKTPGALCYRVATWALFTDKTTGARFIYTNTHLDHGTDEVRVAQAKVVKEKMKQLADEYGSRLPQFASADYNMNRSSVVYPYMLNYKLATKDLWKIARKTAQKGVDGFSSTPDNEIDFIFASGSVSCTYAELGNRNTPDGFIMSDHNPLFADVSWVTSVSDNARAAIADARSAADSTFLWQNSRTRLITSATQLSTDGLQASSSLSSIIDRKTDTYVRSLYSGTLPPNNPHYIQVALKNPVSAFSLQYNKSMDGTAGQADRWDDVLVTASQDGEHWDYVTELFNFTGIQNRTYTANVQMRRLYSHVRFLVMRTQGMVLSNGAPRYSLSEIQMYESTPTDACDYAASETISAAVDALYELADRTQALIDDGTVSAEDVEALEAATLALRQARRDYAQPVEGVTAADDAADDCFYSLDGMRLNVPRKGVNILRGHGGVFRKMMVK